MLSGRKTCLLPCFARPPGQVGLRVPWLIAVEARGCQAQPALWIDLFVQKKATRCLGFTSCRP